LPKKHRDLTDGHVSKNLWYLAVPMMATNALQTLFNVVDMIFVGRLGAAQVAAVSIVGIILMLPFALVLGTSIGSGAMVSRYFGARDYDRAGHAAQQSLLTGFFVGLSLTVIGLFLAPYLIDLFGVEADVHRLAVLYLKIMLVSTAAMALQVMTASVFQAVGDAATAMWINVGAVLLNVVLDPLFIFGPGIFPRWETAGAAWATVIAHFFGMSIALFLLYGNKTHLRLKWEGLHFDWPLIKRILQIGFPGSLQMMLRSASNIIMMGIVTGFGTFAVAAFGIGIRVDMLVLMPGFGLAAATATLVGQNLGAKKPERAVKSAWLALFYYVAFMFTVAVLFYVFAKPIYLAFNDHVEVLEIGRGYLRTLVFSYPFLAVSIILLRALGGAGETVMPMLITGLTLFGLAVPLSYIFPRIWEVGVQGVWLAIVVSNLASAALATLIFVRGKWQHKVV